MRLHPAAGPVAAVILLAATGTVGYVVLGDARWLDALFMTVTTLTTVGYGEVVGPTPAVRAFTILLIVLGVGTFGFAASRVAQTTFDPARRIARRRKLMAQEVAGQRDHVVVCGFGRFGRAVVEELRRGDKTVVVIEQDAALASALDDAGLPHVMGSAAEEPVLDRAGLAHACALVVATGSESENLFITLAAREARPDVRIHARGETDAAVRRLRRAGADQIVSPFHLGGMRTAAAILRPAVVDFLELSRPLQGERVDLEEIRIEAGSTLVGTELGSIERAGARLRVVARRPREGSFDLVPASTERLASGDLLVVIGDRDELAAVARQATAEPPFRA